MKNVAALLLLFCINNANAQTSNEIIEKYGDDSVLVIQRDENAAAYCKGFLVHEKKQGDFDYYLNDALVGTMKYSNDTVIAVTKYYENGIIKSYDEYKNDLLHGVSLTFYPDKTPKTIGEHRKNLRNGTWKLWNESGKLMSETTYTDNIGYCKMYYGKDYLVGEGNVYHNYEFGLWTYYNKRGKVDSYTDFDTMENVIAFYDGK